ncbi:hypothetical protein FOA52_000770 [Chlamydomonas sp. UWO 241]|nr:hypothetical protein FOA52_000770 [Chlamydomonas sp. UWO 241]
MAWGNTATAPAVVPAAAAKPAAGKQPAASAPNWHSVTPKAVMSIKNIGAGMNGNSFVGPALTATYKLKKGRLNASAAVTDMTVLIPVNKNYLPLGKGVPGDMAKLRDVNLTCDYKLPKKGPIPNGLTLNTKFAPGPKHVTAGATWDGKIQNKTTMIKGWWTNKDKKAAGEATMSLNSKNKINTTFTQDQVMTAKYTFVKDSITVEPSYNFPKKAPMVALSKKMKKFTLKATYDVKPEGLTLELAHGPAKITAATKIGPKAKFGSMKPTVGLTYENVFSF